ncbi:hypothetical protein ACOMHN_033274 [Nucella lapillus]
MVEGPGCKLKGEKIRAKVLSQVVKAVCGNAVDREQKSLKKQKREGGEESEPGISGGRQLSQASFHRLLGQKLDEVLTLGKELFMFFGDACLRIHFLMAGSFRVNDVQVDTDGGKKIPASASLEIHFSKDKLTFYKCAAEIRPSSACRQKYGNLKDLDICSPTFSPKLAVREMMVEQDRQLCDVLLDQDVLPGVGNIIKNEALFDSALKPDSKISQLSEEHIAHLVKMTRDFSMLFYKCRKNGMNLRHYMKVYQKGHCGECGTKIVMTRMGEDSERVTYFCPACQTNELKRQGPLKLPTKNSMLGWVQTDPDKETDKEWTCQMCTLLNPANQSNCHKQTCTLRQTFKDNENKGRWFFTCAVTPASKQCRFFQWADEQFPTCSGHGKACALRTVMKQGPNNGRRFFCCPVRRNGCQFFEWASGYG